MARVKAECFYAKNEATGATEEVQFIPPAPEGSDLGGISAEKLKQIDELKEDLYDVSKNLINNKAMVNGYYTTTTTEPTIKENTGLKCILVKIKGNTVYTLSSVSYSSAFYDVNKQKISVLDKSNSVSTFTSPFNAKYISISAYNEYAKTVMLVEGNVLPTEFEN